MADALKLSMAISGAGLAAQSQRLRIVSENLANAHNTGRTPDADPYQRKIISFSSVMDQKLGVAMVKVSRIGNDIAPFPTEFNPSHPAADANGMVKMPNVDALLEMGDMRETIRSYEANMQALKQARELIFMTIDMMGN